MKTKYDAYNSWVSFFIVTCETLITGGLFYLLFLTTEDTLHIPADTRSAFPVISVQSPVSIQCCWQS